MAWPGLHMSEMVQNTCRGITEQQNLSVCTSTLQGAEAEGAELMSMQQERGPGCQPSPAKSHLQPCPHSLKTQMQEPCSAR